MEINIIGAGLAGLSSAITLAKQNISCNLISVLPSERAQSVLAEGGINGALDTMGEGDSPQEHMADTMKAGAYIADPAAVEGLTGHAPGILRRLAELGMPFNMENGRIIQRNFGGQKKKRTAFAKSSTGKMLMSVLIDEARKYEACGLIRRFAHHEFEALEVVYGCCTGVWVRDTFTGTVMFFPGQVIMCTGGLNGFFPGMTTGTVPNTGDAAAKVFSQGVRFSNLEMIQYHPTTAGIAGKRCLVSEAARGEGGRLFAVKDGRPWFFMEEKYPELGNLMPRDVVAREMYFVMHSGGSEGQVFLEMRHLPAKIWKEKLPDFREEIMHYLNIDPAREPVPVEPGIHYFMGGIDVDICHRTNISGLYAAGECCSQYHGANRLGGNSTMGAIYGGEVAAETAADEAELFSECGMPESVYAAGEAASSAFTGVMSRILLDSLGIVRNHGDIQAALKALDELNKPDLNVAENSRIALARAMLLCADYRKESRGAHFREDFPEMNDAYKGETIALCDAESGDIHIGFESRA